MLHQVNEPGCISQLARIVDFQREVFAAACERMLDLPLDKDNIKDTLGNDKGEWFWKKLWKRNQTKSDIHLSLEAIIMYYQQNPQEGIDALNAFDNDILFADHLSDANFRFQYPNLTENNRNLIKPFMIAFYEDLLSSSGFPEIIQGNFLKLDRDNFIESFWQANPELKVCPACDREKSDKVDNKVYDDADHFLPKAKYPFLSVHPFNLFPICIYCNRSIKGEKDMLQNGTLPNIFHPYKRPALKKLDLKVNRDAQGASVIEEFTDIEGMPSIRMENLNRVFRLNERWVERLKNEIENVIEKVINERARLRRRNQHKLINESELKEVLSEEKNDAVRKWGKKSGLIVQYGYLNFALSNQDEFDTLFDYFR